MGDSRRFDLFAKLIRNNFNPQLFPTVADVAGGKGYLQGALREQGYKEVITFDKRKGRRDRPKMRYKYMYFSDKVEDEFNILVGMHPDEATDVIITEAAKRKIPFVVCPCCVKPTDTKFSGDDICGWISHLKGYAERLGFVVIETALSMSGRNVCLIGRRKDCTI